MPIRRDIVTTTNWYAWTVNGTVYYTLSSTPSVGDTVYDSNKQDTGKTISAVGDNTISWNDTKTISFTFSGYTSRLRYLVINGTSYTSAGSADINVGDTVSIGGSAVDGSIYVTESSNTTYIPIGAYITLPPTLTFTMPDEDITFNAYIARGG